MASPHAAGVATLLREKDPTLRPHELAFIVQETAVDLGAAGADTVYGHGRVDALAAIGTRRPSLVILDIWLEGSALDGLQILHALRRDHASVPVIMISGHGTVESAVQAIKMGAYDFIEKPFKADRLLLMVARAIEAARLRRENEELRLRAGGEAELVGIASAAGSLPFPIRASGVLNQTLGLLIYSYQAQATPLFGGLLCVRGPLRRTPAQTSGGSDSGVDCTGSFSFDFNAYIASGADTLLTNVGQQVNAQYWYRDTGDAFGSGLSNAVQFEICN